MHRERTEAHARDPWAENERVAEQRIRDAAKRPLGENLMATLGLCALTIRLRDSVEAGRNRKTA